MTYLKPLLLSLGALLLAAMTVQPSAAAEPIRIMTYNIRYLNQNEGEDHWRNRVDAVAEQIAQAEVVGLQEATKQQIDDLVERRPEYDWYGVGRSDGESGGEFTPVFWRRDRFEAFDKATFWLGPDPAAVGEPAWGANLPRICSWIVLRERESGKLLLVMNTHFDHQSAEARRNSATLIRLQAKGIGGESPVVVMGDLNARPDSEPLRILLDAQGEGMSFVDSRSAEGVQPEGPDGTWNGFREIAPGQRIDYILVGGEQPPKVLAHQTLDPKTDAGRFASDHLPVLVKIEL